MKRIKITPYGVIFVCHNRTMILGIDEAGRGPWAGPLVVGAVVLPEHCHIEGLTDSKKLTKKRRSALEVEIQSVALAYGLGWVHADELDDIGMSAALRLATRRAVSQIKAPYHEIIIDGTVNFLSDTALAAHVTTLPKADALIPAVSAASILAKVARDRFMAEQDELFPGYDFSRHAGYGTAAHQQAIIDNGVSPLHRLSFKPLHHYNVPMARTPHRGAASETMVADYLREKGHEIVARNWRTRLCEIDIISKKDEVIYFTEVKHRTRANGLDAITAQKRAKMRLGAHLYQTKCELHDASLQLAVAVTTGSPPRLTEYLEIE